MLAVGLTAAAIAMLKTAGAPEDPATPSKAKLWLVAIPTGAAIGLASGFLGIGGGIFLGPLILLLGWAGLREVAAINSATVLILSIAGLAAHGLRGAVDFNIAVPLGIAVLIGVPLGIFCRRVRVIRGPVLGVIGILQTIPSLAMLVVLLSLL